MSGNFDFATLGPVMSCPLSVRWVGMYWLIPLVIRYGKVVEPRSWMAERIAAAPCRRRFKNVAPGGRKT
jgi:hypothetical protein